MTALLLTAAWYAALLVAPRVSTAVDALYPPAAYNDRRVLARDAALALSGLSTAEGIPLAGDTMVYGEFDLNFFAQLLSLADPQRGDTLLDVGSGVGRLVLAAALLHADTLRNCHGVEISPPLHDAAIAARVALDSLSPSPPVAPVEFTCGSVLDGAGLEAVEAADVLFSYAVTWASGETHSRLVRALAERLPDGARVISIDLALDAQAAGAAESGARFELLHQLTGPNEETGGEATGLVYRLVRDRRRGKGGGSASGGRP